ncbi:MAG: hypothetical protein DDT22_00861 [candidate division WS2 bacterium]|nr:hypothetical protein [Candidatus Lithacetigena glycinireducens]
MTVLQKSQEKRVSPAERAMLFATMTRQHIQTLPSVAGAENSIVSFSIPKVRLLSKIRLMVTASLTATHATATSYTQAPLAPYSLLRSVEVDTNFGFKIFNVSGIGAYFYNLLRDTSVMVTPLFATNAAVVASRRVAAQGITASPAPGAANQVRFMVDLPLTLNDRDPIGLFLTQNQQTLITVNVQIGNVADIAPAAAGFTFALANIVITPIVETFSIPKVMEALPDVSIIKLVHEQNETITGAGTHTTKLFTGTTYRKLLVYLEDIAGGEADSDLTGLFRLALNQSDKPYEIGARALAAINQEHYGATLPPGLFVFDFTFQGLPNYGGSRDYVDTERLAEFWLEIPAAAAGRVKVVFEHLARLEGV